MNQHILTGQVDITSNLLVGSSHLFVDTTNNRVGLVTTDPHAGLHVNSNVYVNTDLRVGSQIEINATPGRIKAATFEGDGSLLVNAPVGSLAVHSTDTGLPGTEASVTNEGTPTAAEFKFVIPRGDVGATGTAATVAVDGTTVTGAAETDASVTNLGSSSAANFKFTIPRGAQGIQGDPGDNGDNGTNGTNGTNGLNSSGILDIKKNGEVAKFQPATSGEYTLVNFNSKVNSGSDKGFILVQDESAQSPGTNAEDLRMTIGVHNDFRSSTAHSDELWFQGGGRLCYNVGSWDSELNTIIGTPGAGTSHGGVKHEWRINNSAKMTLNSSGDLSVGGSVSATSGVFSGNLTATEVYCQNWIRTKGNSGHYWEGTSNGSGWHIYPMNRSDMYIRTGSGNGGLAFTIENDYVRGFIHCTTSNEIGFLNTGRAWSLRMDNSNNCQVYGRMYASGSVNTTMTARYYNSSGNSGGYNGVRPISVYAEQHMRCSELQVTSDRRIKTDIVDVDDGSALELLRKIQPKTYGYVDTMEKGTNRVYGFIAQEIKELIPEAIDVSEGDLPNIYGHATVDHEQNTITFRDFDTSNLNQTDSIIYIDQDDKRQTLKIKSVLNSTQLEIEEDLEKILETFKTSKLEEYNFTSEIFIWGQHVDDFHHLQKSAIFTVATAALQEVDRQLQAEKVKTKNLEALVLTLISRVQKLETR